MNHDSARLAIEALFSGKGRKRAELRAHLDGCLECRAVYDRTARAFRAMSGRPDEMTPEELWLFEPELPGPPPDGRPRLASWLFGGFATLVAVSLLVMVNPGPPEFAGRGSEQPASVKPGGRAFCAGDGAGPREAALEPCQGSDRLVFAVLGQGRRHAAVVLVEQDKTEVLVSGSQGALSSEPETVLPSAASWRAGASAVVVFSSSPIEPADAERCAKGDCAPGFERAVVPLAPAPSGPK